MAQLALASPATPAPSPAAQHHETAATVSEHLGPFMSDFLHTCYQDNPVALTFVLGTSGVACAATFAIWYRHSAQISAMPLSLLRMYYLRIAMFPPALSFLGFVTLLCPRAFVLCKMLQEQVEALTLTFFGVVLFLLLVEESCQYCKSVDCEMTCGEKIIYALKAQGPKKHFGVPPFGCCFKPWMRPFDLGPRHLRLARFLFIQYAAMVVIGSVLSSWLALALPYERFVVFWRVVNVATKVSGFAAIYGLMILYVATHDLLEHHRTTAKFVSIKLVVFLSTFQELIVSHLLDHVRDLACVSDLLGDTPMSEEAAKKHREHYWGMYLLSIEAVGVALLIWRAFPAAEIRAFEEEHHVLLVDMELQRMHERAAVFDADSSDSEPEEDGSEEDKEAEPLEPSLTPEAQVS